MFLVITVCHFISLRYIISTDTYKPHLALISVQMLEREREREREGECERDKMRDNCSTRLYSSTSVIKRKTLRSVVFILLIIFLKSILNPTIIVICLFMQFFSLFAYITYFNAHLEIKYYEVNIYQIVKDVFKCCLYIKKFLILYGLNPAITVVCLFIYIFLFVCLHILDQ